MIRFTSSKDQKVQQVFCITHYMLGVERSWSSMWDDWIVFAIIPPPQTVRFSSSKDQNVPQWCLCHMVHVAGWKVKVNYVKMNKSFLVIIPPQIYLKRRPKCSFVVALSPQCLLKVEHFKLRMQKCRSFFGRSSTGKLSIMVSFLHVIFWRLESQRSRMQRCWNRFLAMTPPNLVQFTLSCAL